MVESEIASVIEQLTLFFYSHFSMEGKATVRLGIAYPRGV